MASVPAWLGDGQKASGSKGRCCRGRINREARVGDLLAHVPTKRPGGKAGPLAANVDKKAAASFSAPRLVTILFTIPGHGHRASGHAEPGAGSLGRGS